MSSESCAKLPSGISTPLIHKGDGPKWGQQRDPTSVCSGPIQCHMQSVRSIASPSIKGLGGASCDAYCDSGSTGILITCLFCR